ncbi:hypothetical protein [Cellulomonas hominis]
MTVATGATQEAARSSRNTVRVPATVSLIAGWVLVAYLCVALSVQRLLPSASAEPWPLINVIYAMVLIYLPVAAAAGTWRLTRSSTWFRRGFMHVIAMLTVLAVLLLGSMG